MPAFFVAVVVAAEVFLVVAAFGCFDLAGMLMVVCLNWSVQIQLVVGC